MIVLGYLKNGDVCAKYDRGDSDDWSTISLNDYKYPYDCCSYHRPPQGFKVWDGSPVMKEHIMPTQTYRLKTNHTITGVLRGHTSKGQLLLEAPNSVVYTMNKDDVELDIPYTFAVKAMNSGYRCHYTLTPGVSVIVGDILLSDSGNTYRVMEVDTKSLSPKSQFKGQRVVTEPMS